MVLLLSCETDVQCCLCVIGKDDQHKNQDCKALTSTEDDDGDSEDDDVTEAVSHASET